jgi:beta-mannosidase
VRVAVAVGARSAHLTVELRRAGKIVACHRRRLKPGRHALKLAVDAPELWWPAGEGSPALYEVRVDAAVAGRVVATWTREVGFKHVTWRPNAGAPAGALPWICVVNHRPVFLQGVNWTPARLDYLEARSAEVRGLVAQYRKIGCNLLRVWGGAGLETTEFYAACDRAGLMVWQEFPLSSSGMDSCPPEDVAFVAEAAAIARHFVRARQHHASLLLWCGGNELHRTVDGTPGGARRPLEASHPVLAALTRVVAREDPGRRFLPTSPFGPRFGAMRDEFGRGLHHAVHGPWGLDGFAGMAEWKSYWQDDDALFRSEVGVAGACEAGLIARFAGNEPLWPPTNAYWQHTAAWWAQWERLRRRIGAAPAAEALPRYVALTQREQAEHLALAARLTKARFPACGGFLVWMGHDAFPCPANTSLIDFERKLKPAAHALAAVFGSQNQPARLGSNHPSRTISPCAGRAQVPVGFKSMDRRPGPLRIPPNGNLAP